jgi:hypothetical protein
MQIYIADLDAYNSGYLKGEWIELPTDNENIKEFADTVAQMMQF